MTAEHQSIETGGFGQKSGAGVQIRGNLTQRRYPAGSTSSARRPPIGAVPSVELAAIERRRVRPRSTGPGPSPAWSRRAAGRAARPARARTATARGRRRRPRCARRRRARRLGALAHHLDRDARLRPLAGIVDQVADHLFQVRPLAAEARLLVGIDVDGDAAVAMDLLHGARERGDHRRHLGDGADHRRARRDPRALEMARAPGRA